MLRILLLLSFLIVSSVFCAEQKDYNFKAKTLQGDFVLNELGRPAIVYFGYTYCPDVCPTTLFLVNNAVNELKIDAQIVFISVDLERDSLENCDKFAKHFRKDAICARLEKDDLERVAEIYGAKYKVEHKDDDIIVAHTPYVYLIKDGILVSEITNLASKALKRELLKIK